MKKTPLFFILWLFAGILFASKGVHVELHSYLPNIKVRITQQYCVDGAQLLTVNQTAKIESTCVDDEATLGFVISDDKQTLAEFHISHSQSRGTVLSPEGYQAVQDKRIVAQFYPGEGDKDDRVSIRVSAPLDAWMKEMGHAIQQKPLQALIIPGTHDSGAFRMQEPLELSPDIDITLKEQLENSPEKSEYLDLIQSWVVTQSMNTSEALQLGIRYFDLRLCKHGDAISTCHGLYATPLDDVLDSIAQFMNSPNHEKELIILDINHQYGLNSKDRVILTERLKSYFGTKIASSKQFSPQSLVNEFWEQQKQIIIFMEQSGSKDSFYWEPTDIDSPWPNTEDPEVLQASMLEALSNRDQQSLFVLQTQTTPSFQTIAENVLNKTKRSTLKMATAYKPKVFNWLTSPENRALLQSQGNIIIEDFSNGIDLTELAKALNQR